MKNLSRALNSRRIKGLFASIIENGSMVSLAGKWEVYGECAKANTKGLVSDLEKKGFEVKTKNLDSSSDMILKRTQGSLADLILGFGWRVISVAFPNKVKFAGRLRLLRKFSVYLYRMYKTNGAEQVVKYLKAAQLAVQKSIGKDGINNLKDLDPSVMRSKLTGYGLPVIIPSRDRKLINGGHVTIIRFWLTLFSVYRVIDIKGILKIETIVTPLTADISKYSVVVSQFCNFLNRSAVTSMMNTRHLLKEGKLRLDEASSATQKVSWAGSFSDPKLLDALGLSDYIRKILSLTGQVQMLGLYEALLAMDIRTPESLLNPPLDSETVEGVKKFPCLELGQVRNPHGSFAGKLSVKKEPAGKLRVFAMATTWDQSVLAPIHEMLFAFLKGLPNDGTFDQHASEMRARSKAINAGRSYGYDLTAATDRLPIEIQSALLNLVEPGLGDA
jgi:hypothetical protein